MTTSTKLRGGGAVALTAIVAVGALGLRVRGPGPARGVIDEYPPDAHMTFAGCQ